MTRGDRRRLKRGVAAERSASLRATTGGGGPQAPPTRTTSLPSTGIFVRSSRGVAASPDPDNVASLDRYLRTLVAGGRRGKECELASNDWRRGGGGFPGPAH